MPTLTHDGIENAFKGAACSVRFDDVARQLYATDASIYQVEPAGVAFPEGPTQAQEVVQRANESGLTIIPRGAGTGLAGGAIGEGLVIDFSKNNRQITEFNLDARTARVGPGVVLDQLNAYLAPHGLRFGPDVATSSRATLGGMIGNNSSGSHVPIYGTTSQHIRSLDVLLADGRIERIGEGHAGLEDLRTAASSIVDSVARQIGDRMPPGIIKRWHGYGFSEFLRHPGDLSRLVSASEGTLCAVVSAELNLVPVPKDRAIGLIFFDSVTEAMAATVDLLDLNPAAIEHVDRILFEQTRGQLAFKEARAVLELDQKPCESILIVEFFDDDVDDRLERLKQKNLGTRSLLVRDANAMQQVWSLRKAGLSLLTGCKGASKPTAGIEDVAVRPEQLPAYVEGLRAIMTPLGLDGSFYGHAASGLLHVRPSVDLHDAGDIAKFRQVADEVSALVKEFKASIAAEHGVGLARTEFLEDHVGPEIMSAMRQVKMLFDPDDRFNPGKIVGHGRFKFDEDLRWGAGHNIPLPFTPVLAFAAKDESFIGNLEQCNGCGGCRKDAPTMCPTFLATGEEIMSTRGRANAIRASLEARVRNDGNRLRAAALEEALSNCLSCKACTTECPSNVNMALIKAELQHARHRLDGVPLSDRVLGSADILAIMASVAPGIANATLQSPFVRRLMQKYVGLSSKRALPAYAPQSFNRWFQSHVPHGDFPRGDVLLWDDTFTRYNDPHIGRAALHVLEAAGYHVKLPYGRSCCGRPAFSNGLIDRARRLAKANISLLEGGDGPIIFLEASCFSMFVEDYRELGVDGASEIAARCVLFEDFMAELLDAQPDALAFSPRASSVAIHGHCHAKALTGGSAVARLTRHLPHGDVSTMKTGCCGMAGAFGMKEEKQALSEAVAGPLIGQIEDLDSGTCVIANGTSCRHQIDALTNTTPRHIAELLADHLA